MYQRRISLGSGPLTEAVKMLIIANVAVFILQSLSGMIVPGIMEKYFGISHDGLITEMRIWQLFTYMFLHGGLLHLLFNLFALWMFGGDLERLWGKQRFIRYYLFSGLGAGFFIGIMNAYMNTKGPYFSLIPTLGASGAIYALLLAYGMTWPNREVYLYFAIPVKMKYLIIGYGLLEFYGTIGSISGNAGGISHIGHLGGLATGFLLIMYYRKNHSSGGSFYVVQGKKTSLFSRLKQKYQNSKQKDLWNNRILAKEIIDRTLDKVSKNGINSLTDKERADLEWARKNYHIHGNDTIH